MALLYSPAFIILDVDGIATDYELTGERNCQ